MILQIISVGMILLAIINSGLGISEINNKFIKAAKAVWKKHEVDNFPTEVQRTIIFLFSIFRFIVICVSAFFLLLASWYFYATIFNFNLGVLMLDILWGSFSILGFFAEKERKKREKKKPQREK